ncbi:MAG: glycosyltransferase family 4 protein [Patescibacteria group bacterium]|nr:glycosyltransferase family 4 protein [Patescibacteria group bacterium]
MKIAQISYLYYPSIGGVESHVKNLSEQLVARGHRVEVFTSDFDSLQLKKRIIVKEENVNGVVMHRFPGKQIRGKNFFAQKLSFGPIKKVLLSGDFDVIHCHSIPSDHFRQAFEVAKSSNKKIFVTPHFSPNDLEKTFKTFLTPWYWRLFLIPKLKRINRLFAVSPSEKKAFQKLTDISEDKLTVIPNGVDIKEIQSVTEKEIKEFKKKNIDPAKKLILFVGRIVLAKGIDTLIEAVNKLSDQKIQVLIIGPVGDIEYYQRLKKLISDYNLVNTVFIKEFSRREVLIAFHACDVFVLPTRGEVFGIVLAEAMACEKPVIGSRVGGIPDLIKDGVTGYLFESENSEDLAQKISDVLNNSSEGINVGKLAKEEIEKNYNWERISIKIEKNYFNSD